MNKNIERVNPSPGSTRNIQPPAPSNEIQYQSTTSAQAYCRNTFFPGSRINVVFITHSANQFPVKIKMHPHPTDLMEKPNSEPSRELKLVEFSLQMPTAKSVQLAADFTDWEAAPIDMVRFGDGMWSTTVPLPPGTYAYRFLVDGNWHDDPKALKRRHDFTGMAEAFVRIN